MVIKRKRLESKTMMDGRMDREDTRTHKDRGMITTCRRYSHDAPCRLRAVQQRLGCSVTFNLNTSSQMNTTMRSAGKDDSCRAFFSSVCVDFYINTECPESHCEFSS